jgi:hypothetical protein
VQAHEQGDRDGQADGKYTPGALRQRPHDHVPEARERDDDDEQDRQRRDRAEHGSELGTGNLRQGAASTTRARHQDHEIVHGAAEHHPEQDPEETRQEPELRREDRTDQRPRPGDGRKMMAEQHPLVGRVKIVPVVVLVCRRASPIVQTEHPGSEESGVIPIGQSQHGEGGQQPPGSVHIEERTPLQKRKRLFALVPMSAAPGGGIAPKRASTSCPELVPGSPHPAAL